MHRLGSSLFVVLLSGCGAMQHQASSQVWHRTDVAFDDEGQPSWLLAAKPPPNFEQLGPFGDGRAGFVDEEGRYGFVDPSFQVVIPPTFQWAGDFSEGLAPILDARGLGFVDVSGDVVVHSIDGDRMGSLRDGLSWVRRGSRFGYLGRDGQVRIEIQFESAHDFSEGLAAVRIQGRFGYIDRGGNVVIEPAFRMVGEFRGNRAWAQLESGKYIYIDQSGERLFDGEYDAALPFAGDFAAVQLEDSFRFLKADGELIGNECASVAYYGGRRVLAVRDGRFYRSVDGGMTFEAVEELDPLIEVTLASEPAGAAVYKPTRWDYDHAPDVASLLTPTYKVPEGTTRVVTKLDPGTKYRAIFVHGSKLAECDFVPRANPTVSVELPQ